MILICQSHDNLIHFKVTYLFHQRVYHTLKTMFVITVLLLSIYCVCADHINNEIEESLFLPDPLHQLEIVNGTAADEGEFPFAVGIIFFLIYGRVKLILGVFEIQ